MWRTQQTPLIPAQAGTQSDNVCAGIFDSWAPAFAGTNGDC
jgi:hypothetical protein